MKGKPTQTRSSAFIDPLKNLSVSPGAKKLRLGSLLSAFISVCLTIPLSLSLLSLSLPPNTSVFFLDSLSLSLLLFSPKETEKKMSPEQISGSLQHCLSPSVYSTEWWHHERKFQELYVSKLCLSQVWNSVTLVVLKRLNILYIADSLLWLSKNTCKIQG